MYDSVSLMADAISPTPGPGRQIPQVTLDGAVVPSATPWKYLSVGR